MKLASSFVSALVFIAAMSLFEQRSYADIAMTAQEVGSDVVFSYSGSIDLTGLGAGEPGNARGAVYPVNEWVGFGPSVPTTNTITFYSGSVNSAPTDIGTGEFQVASSSTGNQFSINNISFSVPLGYVSESRISGSITFNDKTLTTLGVDSAGGPYEWALTNGQKVTLSFLDPVAGPANDNSGAKKAIQKKVKKLKKQIKGAKAKQQVAKLKSFKKKLKTLKAELKAL